MNLTPRIHSRNDQTPMETHTSEDARELLNVDRASAERALHAAEDKPILSGEQSCAVAQVHALLAIEQRLSQLAATRGLPPARSKQCLSNDGSINQLVKMTGNATTEYPDFKGTPTFVINGAMVDLGPVTEAQVWPALESKIRAALGERH